MRARVAALGALILVIALTWTGLTITNNQLEAEFTSTIPQLAPADTVGEEVSTGTAAGPEVNDTVQPATDITTWETENNYLMRDNLLRLGWGPTLKSQTGHGNAERNPNSTHVLAVGDSFVWGEAVEDLDMRWPQVLERTLNKQNPNHTYTVTPLGRLPASFMQMVDWLSAERLNELKPDIVVIGYLNNDVIPTFEESTLCNKYGTCNKDGGIPVSWNRKNGRLVECLKGEDSPMSFLINTAINPHFPYVGRWLTNRYCDPDRVAKGDIELQEGQWIENPTDGPYWPNMQEAIERLGRNLKGTPTVVFDYWDIFKRNPSQARVKELLEENGIIVIGMTETEKLLAATEDESILYVNPADSHPGPQLTHAYARDISDTLFKIAQEQGLTQASNTSQSSQDIERPLVSNYLPSTLTLTTDARTFTARGRPMSNENRETHRGIINRRGPQELTIETACARIGRPHARIMLNPYLENHTLTIQANKAPQPLVLVRVGYDPNGLPTMSEPTVLTQGSTITLDMGENYRGVLIGSGQAGCEPDTVKLPVFDLTGTISAK